MRAATGRQVPRPPRAATQRLAQWLSALIVVVWTASAAIGFEASLAILSLVGVALAVVGIRSPASGAIGLAMLCAVDSIVRLFLMTGGLWRYNTFSYVLLLVAVAYLPATLRALSGPCGTLLAAFIALVAVQAVPSASPAAAMQDVLSLLSVLGLVGAFERARGEPYLWHSIGLVNGVLAASGGLAFYLLGLQPINPNAWSWFPLAGMLSICLAAATGEPGTLPVLAFVNLVWVFLSGSRGDLLLGLLAAGFILAVNRGVTRRAVYAAVALLLALGLTAAFVQQTEHAVGRLQKAADADVSLRNRTSGRSDLIRGGWYIFRDSPLGVGTGGFPAAWAALGGRDGLTFRPGREMTAHAGWIKTAAENGLFGVLLLAAFVGSFAVMGLRQRTREQRWLGPFVSLLMCAALWVTEFQGKSLWLFVVGAIVLLQRAEPTVRHARARRRMAVGQMRINVEPH